MYQRYERNPRPITRAGVISTPSLLAQVLGITAAGFLITAAGAYLSWSISALFGMLAMLVGFGFLIAISGTRANPALSLACFYGFTALEGVGLAPTLHRYVAALGPDIVVNAAATTGVGMATLGAVVYMTSIDFRKFQGIAFMALLVLVVVSLISAFVHFLHPGTIAWFSLLVFTLLVLVDFSRIRAGGDGLSPVELAVQIYLDGINIFLSLLEIFGLRSREE
jgi:FtsH-binding integral membrane protein